MYERQVFTGLPNGTVCLFSGSYRLSILPPYSTYEEKKPTYSSYTIPVSSGHAPPPAVTDSKNIFQQTDRPCVCMYVCMYVCTINYVCNSDKMAAAMDVFAIEQ